MSYKPLPPPGDSGRSSPIFDTSDLSDLHAPQLESNSARNLGEIPRGRLPQSESKRGNAIARRRLGELKLVYRILRLISDWALAAFFSEVLVIGTRNIDVEGALILTPCHHNEIIDIATLSATIPHRRIITYWTKASLFKNPISRFILRSAGTIPVARSRLPAHNETDNCLSLNGNKKETDSAKRQEMLFNATYKDLARGGALAVFPEGTSYTMPRIVQVKEGAARAALGFARWASDKGFSDIVSVVPVGIVYTDKSKYRSRLYVQYGKQIPLELSVKQFLLSEDGSEEERDIVQQLTANIEKEMLRITINARDWETLYAAQTARDILWTEERNIPLETFVDVSQALIGIFEKVSPSDALGEVKAALLRYHALQYHTGVTHASLSHIPLASPSFSDSSSSPSHLQLSDSASRLASSFPSSRLSLIAYLPSAILSLVISSPVHLAYAPGYILGALAARTFASEEEEARAQFKVIFGGFGNAVGTFVAGLGVWRLLTGRVLTAAVRKGLHDKVTGAAINLLQHATSFLPSKMKEATEGVGKCLASFGSATGLGIARSMRFRRLENVLGAIGIALLLSVWHARVIDGNHRRFKHIRATFMVLRSSLLSPSSRSSFSEDKLKPYLTTPPPLMNPYITKSIREGTITNTSLTSGNEQSLNKPANESVSNGNLVRHLLHARTEATIMLQNVFKSQAGLPGDSVGATSLSGGSRGEGETDVRKALLLLRDCGAKI